MSPSKTRFSPKLKAKKPVPALLKPVKVDFKDLFKALAKAIGHTATTKWVELGADTVEALSALGLATEPGELAYLLIRRSMTHALFELVGENATQIGNNRREPDDLFRQLDFADTTEVELDRNFFDRPASLPTITAAQELLRQWLLAAGLENNVAQAIARRLPSYFVYALNHEWRRNAPSYRPIIEAIENRFSKASDQEWAWIEYGSLLEKRIEESVFDETFSLSQLYIPLNAYFLEDRVGDESGRHERQRRHVIVSLDAELTQWLVRADRIDAIRVISGGPGSGKSSFARVFSARIKDEIDRLRVLFIPLHLIDPARDLIDEVGRFVRDEGILRHNPLDPDSLDENLLIIFDGLDELASQGKAAAETARAFVREVEKTTERKNQLATRLRVIISGRELVVQENDSEFRRPRQILTLLPYLPKLDTTTSYEENEFVDPYGILNVDLRQQWWKNYGSLTGTQLDGLPVELSRPDLDEVTAQPLLNHLVALTFTRNKLDFTKDINVNSVYAGLVAAVHERSYENRRPYGPIRHMNLADFLRVLEEVGLAAWHGDGRSTSVREIEAHCEHSGLGEMLEVFQEGAKAGVTRLLAAFFFRQYGRRATGDPTFVFTHKSFGEYLAARRILRAIERVSHELDSRSSNPDAGWDEKDGLKYWSQICGPTAISRYLQVFLQNEMSLRDPALIGRWQICFSKLFSFVLRHGMPMEQLQVGSFNKTVFQARNAEEALLVALNLCARVTKEISRINYPDVTAFGGWFKRIQGQRTGAESIIAADCLSYMDLSGIALHICDFYGANLQGSQLRGTAAHFTCFRHANLKGADLSRAQLTGASFEGARLQGAIFDESRTIGADFNEASLDDSSFKDAVVSEFREHHGHRYQTQFRSAKLTGVDFSRAILNGALFDLADLSGAQLESANLKRASLKGTNLEGANLHGVEVDHDQLAGAVLDSKGKAETDESRRRILDTSR